MKDPSKRPTAEKLLKLPFFKQARGQDYVCQLVFNKLPPLGERVANLKVTGVRKSGYR